MEPEKPFACPVPECGMTFTNEDHLHVHTKKHDMVLQLGAEQRAAFVADQTPTPTRFIRNCEEVGLFQDLQNVNPFDEGFKRAMENKQGLLSMEATTPASASSDDVLHTPQNVFPLLATGETFSTTNKNVTISRSSSDESGTIKEYETTTISKLTNEVTTISRLVGNRELVDKTIVDDTPVAKNPDPHQNKDIETVYKNKVIKIHNNIEIRKDGAGSIDKPVLIYTDSVIKDSSVVTKDVLLTDVNKLQVVEKVPPIMSQKSLDFVVDSLTSDLHHTNANVLDRDKNIHVNKANIVHSGNVNMHSDFDFNVKPRAIKRGVRKKVDAENTGNRIEMINDRVIVNNEERQSPEDYEVIIKLPNGKKVRMKTVEEYKPDTKEILRKSIEKKAKTKNVQAPFINPVVHNVLQIPGGTLIPVTLVNNIGAPLQTGIPVTNNIVLPITQSLAKIPISIDPNARVKEKNVSKSRISPKNPVIINLTESDDESHDNIKELQSSANMPTLDINDRLNGNVSSNVQSKSEEIAVRQNVPNDPRDIERYKLDCKSAASRRYRNRLKQAAASRRAEVRSLHAENRRLRARTFRLLALLQRHAPDVAMAESEAMAREQLKIGTYLEDEL